MTSTSTIIHPLETQVGGHADIGTTDNGLVIKPAAPAELAFYQRLQQDSDLEDLRDFTPTFLGTLKLMGKVDEASSAMSESIVVESVASEEEKDESLILSISTSGPDAMLFFGLFFFFFLESTIHCSRKSLLLFPQTQYSRHQTRKSVIR
jgi:hypothetical protein